MKLSGHGGRGLSHGRTVAFNTGLKFLLWLTATQSACMSMRTAVVPPIAISKCIMTLICSLGTSRSGVSPLA